MIDKIIRVNLGSEGVPPVVKITQGDDQWRFRFQVFHSAQRYTIPSGTTLILSGKKPDGHGVELTGTLSGNEAVVACSKQLTAAAGIVTAALQLFESGSGKLVNSCPVFIACAPDAKGGAEVSDSDLSAYETLIAALEDLIDRAEALPADIPGLVTDWLDQHIDPATGYVLDRSLSVPDAAAPADLTGDLRAAYNETVGLPNVLPDDLTLTRSGNITNAAQHGSTFVLTTNGGTLGRANIYQSAAIGDTCFEPGKGYTVALSSDSESIFADLHYKRSGSNTTIPLIPTAEPGSYYYVIIPDDAASILFRLNCPDGTTGTITVRLQVFAGERLPDTLVNIADRSCRQIVGLSRDMNLLLYQSSVNLISETRRHAHVEETGALTEDLNCDVVEISSGIVAQDVHYVMLKTNGGLERLGSQNLRAVAYLNSGGEVLRYSRNQGFLKAPANTASIKISILRPSATDDLYMVYNKEVYGEALTVYHPDKVPGVLTPELFSGSDAERVQACFDEGAITLLRGEYDIGDATLRINKTQSVYAMQTSAIRANSHDPYDDVNAGSDPSPVAIIDVSAPHVRLEGLRCYSTADKKPYIDLAQYKPDYPDPASTVISGKASNRTGITIRAGADNCTVIDLYGDHITLLRIAADACLIRGLHGHYIENGIYTPGTRQTIVEDVDFNVSAAVLSRFYHPFYYANPVDCIFANVAVGIDRSTGSFAYPDIFHFNYSREADEGGKVVVDNAVAPDNAFQRFTQINNNVQAYFSNCAGKFKYNICILGTKLNANAIGPNATFTGCDFELLTGNNNYGLKCSLISSSIRLNGCRITDHSDGLLFTGGVIANNCEFVLDKMQINDLVVPVEEGQQYRTCPKYVRFRGCSFDVAALVNIAPDTAGFSAEYYGCVFKLAAEASALVASGNSADVTFICDFVEGAADLYTGQDTNKIMTAIMQTSQMTPTRKSVNIR